MRLFKKEAPQFDADDVKATQDVVQAITAALKSGAEQQDICLLYTSPSPRDRG